jgi:predicted dehydrogenase
VYRPNEAKDWINFGEGYNTLRALTRQMSHFVSLVAGEETAEISPGDVVESVRTIEAAYQSLQTGQFVRIHPAARGVGSALGARKLSALHSHKAPHTG